jgi:hypothetical protein
MPFCNLKNFLLPKAKNVCNKLECLSLEAFLSIALCLCVKPVPTRVKHVLGVHSRVGSMLYTQTIE